MRNTPPELVIFDVDGTLNGIELWWPELLRTGLKRFASQLGIELRPGCVDRDLRSGTQRTQRAAHDFCQGFVAPSLQNRKRGLGRSDQAEELHEHEAGRQIRVLEAFEDRRQQHLRSGGSFTDPRRHSLDVGGVRGGYAVQNSGHGRFSARSRSGTHTLQKYVERGIVVAVTQQRIGGRAQNVLAENTLEVRRSQGDLHACQGAQRRESNQTVFLLLQSQLRQQVRRLSSSDHTERIGGGGPHVGVGVLQRFDQRAASRFVSDSSQRIDGELAHVDVITLQLHDQGRHNGGAAVHQRFHRSIAPARVLTVGERRDQGSHHLGRLRAGHQPLDGRPAHSPAGVPQCFDQPRNGFGGRTRQQAVDGEASDLLVRAL